MSLLQQKKNDSQNKFQRPYNSRQEMCKIWASITFLLSPTNLPFIHLTSASCISEEPLCLGQSYFRVPHGRLPYLFQIFACKKVNQGLLGILFSTSQHMHSHPSSLLRHEKVFLKGVLHTFRGGIQK